MFRRPLFLRCTASSITGRITLMESIVNGTPAVDAHRSHLHDREDVHMPLIRVPLPAVKVAVPQSIAVEPQADVISEALTKAVLPQPEVTVPTPEVPVPTPEVTVPTAAHEETPKVEMALATDALKSNGTAETANATTMIVSNSFTAPEVINVPVVEPLTVQTVAAVPPTLAAEKSTREASAVVVSVPVVEPPIVVPAVLPIPPHMIPTKLPLLDAKFTRLRKRMVSDHLRHMTAAAAAKRAGLPPPAHELRFVVAVQKLYKKKLPPNADELAVVLERKIAADTATTWATAKHGQYMHIDMDMFFAAVELRDDPLLAAKPFVVANKGMIVCADYKARQFGIRTGTPVSYAKRHCPSLVAVEGDMKKYTAASEHFKQILRDYDPHMRGFGLDEATLDLGPFLASLNDAPDRAVRLADLCTKCSLPPPSQHAMTTNVSLVSLALAIRHRVMAETQLPCSIGTAPTFALAKMAADSQKPLGATHLPADREAISAFMLTQNVADIIGVGPRAQETLALLNVFTVKDAYAQRVRLQQLLKKDSFTFLMRATAGLHAPLTSSDTSRASVAMKDDVDEPPPPGARRSSGKRKTVGRMVSVLQPRKRAALSKAHTTAPNSPLAALHLDKTPSPLPVERSAAIRRSAALDANAARANKRRTRSVPVVTVPVPGTPPSAATATAPSPESVRHKVKLTFAFAFPSVDLTTGEHDAHLDGFTREVMKVVPTLDLPSPQHQPTTEYPVVPVPRVHAAAKPQLAPPVAPLPNLSASSDDISRVIAKTMRIATPPTLLEDSSSSTRRSARTMTIVTATDVSAEATTTSKEAKKSKATSSSYPRKVPTVTTLPAIVVPVPTLPAVVTKAPKAVAKRPKKVTKTAPAARPHTVDTTTVSVVTSSFYPVPAEAKVEAVGALTPNMSVDQRVTTTLAVGQSAIQELHFSPFSARTVTVTVKVYAASADSHNVQRPSYVLHSASASLHTASRDATELISLVKHAVKDIHQFTETALPEDLSRLAGVKVVLHDLYRTNVASRRMLW